MGWLCGSTPSQAQEAGGAGASRLWMTRAWWPTLALGLGVPTPTLGARAASPTWVHLLVNHTGQAGTSLGLVPPL